MNLEEFFRQAHYLRDFTPTLTGNGGTISLVNIHYCKFMVIGRLVIMLLNAEFTITGGSNVAVTTTLPTLANLNGPCAYSGRVDDSTAGFAFSLSAGPPDKMNILRYDGGFWTVGVITGLLFYANGEAI